MGKKENLKRQKWLRERKKAETGKDQAKDPKGFPGIDQVQTEYGDVKLSELLTEFATPILEVKDKLPVVKMKFELALLAWNTGLLNEEEAEIIQMAQAEFGKIYNDPIGIERGFELLLKRKREEYADYPFYLLNVKIADAPNGKFKVTVGGTPYLL